MMAKSKRQYYIMFGYCKDDIDEVGYFGNDLSIVKDSSEAKLFPLKNYKRKKQFKTPEEWLKFINNDSSINNGYKFHLVKTLKNDETS